MPLDRLGRQSQHGQFPGAYHIGCGTRGPQPLADAEPSSAARVRMSPRVVRVDRRGQRGERGLDHVVGLAIGVGEPRNVRADVPAVGEQPGVLAGQVRERRDQGESELGDQAGVRRVEWPDHLAAELDQPAVGERGLLDAAAGPVAGLQDDHVGAARDQVAGGGQAGQAGAENDDVVRHCKCS